MVTRGLFVRLEAKPGKEEEVAAFLMRGLQVANQEATTPLWFALKFGSASFGVFGAFPDEAAAQNRLNGPMAKALVEIAPTLLAITPSIERAEIIGAKLP